jgi:hypothetical protein
MPWCCFPSVHGGSLPPPLSGLASSGIGDPVGVVAANLAFKWLTADAAEPFGKEPISRRVWLTVPVAASY